MTVTINMRLIDEVFTSNRIYSVSTPWGYHGVFMEKRDQKSRTTDNEEISCKMWEVPEFIVDDEGNVKVNAHRVYHLFSGDQVQDFIHAVNNGTATYQEISNIIDTMSPIRRKVVRGMALSTWVSKVIESDSYNKGENFNHSLAVEAVTDQIRRLALSSNDWEKYEIILAEDEDEVQEWYSSSEFNDETGSCMTSDGRSEYTRIWGSNPNACRLAKLVDPDNGSLLARFVMFKPGTALSVGETPKWNPSDGYEGWYFGRVYVANSFASQIGGSRRAMDYIVRRLNQLGIKKMGIFDGPDTPNGVVALWRTEYAPYVDCGCLYWSPLSDSVFWVNSEEGVKLLKTKHPQHKEADCNQYGTAFGHTKEGADCHFCENTSDEEDMTYVEGYGYVCEDCLSDNFTWCQIHDCYYHNDDVIEFRSHEYDNYDGSYIHDGSNRIVLNSGRVSVTHVDHFGCAIAVPADETVTLFNGELAWLDSSDIVDITGVAVWSNTSDKPGIVVVPVEEYLSSRPGRTASALKQHQAEGIAFEDESLQILFNGNHAGGRRYEFHDGGLISVTDSNNRRYSGHCVLLYGRNNQTPEGVAVLDDNCKVETAWGRCDLPSVGSYLRSSVRPTHTFGRSFHIDIDFSVYSYEMKVSDAVSWSARDLTTHTIWCPFNNHEISNFLNNPGIRTSPNGDSYFLHNNRRVRIHTVWTVGRYTVLCNNFNQIIAVFHNGLQLLSVMEFEDLEYFRMDSSNSRNMVKTMIGLIAGVTSCLQPSWGRAELVYNYRELVQELIANNTVNASV